VTALVALVEQAPHRRVRIQGGAAKTQPRTPGHTISLLALAWRLVSWLGGRYPAGVRLHHYRAARSAGAGPVSRSPDRAIRCTLSRHGFSVVRLRPGHTDCGPGRPVAAQADQLPVSRHVLCLAPASPLQLTARTASRLAPLQRTASRLAPSPATSAGGPGVRWPRHSCGPGPARARCLRTRHASRPRPHLKARPSRPLLSKKSCKRRT
jgi:hypothetical protein